MSNLFRSLDEEPPGSGPALLAVVSLMLLLLPFLLLTTSPQKLTAIQLTLLSDGESLPARPGAVEDVRVEISGSDARVLARVRRTDVTASTGDVEVRRVEIPGTAAGVDYGRLQAAIASIAALDPGLRGATLEPADDVPTEVVMAVIDAVRTRSGQPLLPDVVLGGQP